MPTLLDHCASRTSLMEEYAELNYLYFTSDRSHLSLRGDTVCRWYISTCLDFSGMMSYSFTISKVAVFREKRIIVRHTLLGISIG